jgi:hypothetical protein
MSFPKHVLDAIRDRADLAAMIGVTVTLRREGRDLVGCCPFHNEKSASFHVTPSTGLYHCFGCGEGGGVFEWVQKREGVSFPDAVRKLAAELGVDLGSEPAKPSAAPAARRGRVLPIEGAGSGDAGGRRKRSVPSEDDEQGDDAQPEDHKDAEHRATKLRASAAFRALPWGPDIVEKIEATLWADDGAAPVREYLLNRRRLTEETLCEFGVGAVVVRDASGKVLDLWAAIPIYDRDKRVQNVKLRAVPGPCPACESKGCERCAGTGKTPDKPKYLALPRRPLPLFGADRLDGNAKHSVYVTEGEFDVLALHQYGWTSNVVSGTAGAAKWDDAWLDEIEPYEQAVLLYDPDTAGEKGADALAGKLGRDKCARVVLPHKDPGECVERGIAREVVERAVRMAKPMTGLSIVRPSSFAAEIEARIADPERMVGYATGSAKVDRCLGGDRPGLTIVTGDSGSGKTTFTCWQAWERARIGVPSLTTAFEQSPVMFAEKLLRLQIGGDFSRATPAERAAAWAALDALPLYVVGHHGQTNYDDILATVRYAVRRLDVKFALLDHLGYFVDPDAKDKVNEIERVVKGLALAATSEGWACWLVAHPSNQNIAQQRRVQMGDLKGASAIRQEAAAVIVVERNPSSPSRAFPSTSLHFDKVRAEWGLAGSSCWLAFDPESTRYADGWEQTPMGARLGGKPPPNAPGAPVDVGADGEARTGPVRRRRTVPAEEAGEVAPPKPAVPSWHDRDERDDVTLDADGIPV